METHEGNSAGEEDFFSFMDNLPPLDRSQKQEIMSMMKSYEVQNQNQPVMTTDDNNGGQLHDGGGSSTSRVMLDKETISKYFHMPISQAAKELNVGTTLLKKRCRKFGIQRWPHRKLKSLQTIIDNVQQGLSKESGDEAEGELEETVLNLEREKKKVEEIPDLQLEDNTKRLRQACFKAKYRKRRNTGTVASSASVTSVTDHQDEGSSTSVVSLTMDHVRRKLYLSHLEILPHVTSGRSPLWDKMLKC